MNRRVTQMFHATYKGTSPDLQGSRALCRFSSTPGKVLIQMDDIERFHKSRLCYNWHEFLEDLWEEDTDDD